MRLTNRAIRARHSVGLVTGTRIHSDGVEQSHLALCRSCGWISDTEYPDREDAANDAIDHVMAS